MGIEGRGARRREGWLALIGVNARGLQLQSRLEMAEKRNHKLNRNLDSSGGLKRTRGHQLHSLQCPTFTALCCG